MPTEHQSLFDDENTRSMTPSPETKTKPQSPIDLDWLTKVARQCVTKKDTPKRPNAPSNPPTENEGPLEQ